MKKSPMFMIVTLLLFTVNAANCQQVTGAVDLNNNNSTIAGSNQLYQFDATQEIVALVKDASEVVRVKGEAAFNDFRLPGSRWRHEETYIFVLDPEGKMIVHYDTEMEGKNQMDLKDVNGKPIIRGLLDAATALPGKTEGWYHYQWPVPGGLLPRWKSSYVQLVTAPSGKKYIIGSGIYNDRMEKGFVVDLVKDAIGQIEINKDAAFRSFHNPKGPFMAKDAYIFVIDAKGTELVNPAFPNLEGRNLMDLKDTEGKLLVREMLKIVEENGSGWVNYMWPKPGESVSTQKSTYVSKAKTGNTWILVGCGVYLADAPKTISAATKMNATELMRLVNEAAVIFGQQGEKAYPEFRQKGSKWFRDDTYFFVWSMNGERVFHAANPEGEGINMSGVKDVLGRPWGKMFLETASTSNGAGWVHYMYPEPGDIFPTWKSSFLKLVTYPSGKQYIIGCGIYNMQMDKAFIEDVVNRAASLLKEKGKQAFSQLRDKTGPYIFLDTYVFVDSPQGIELVNGAQPSMEGKNLIDLKDANGKFVAREYIDNAMKNGSTWVYYYWYRPGENTPSLKYTYVKKVQHGTETYLVGAGLYVEEEFKGQIKSN